MRGTLVNRLGRAGILASVGACAAILAVVPAAADVKTGVDAWSAGDYEKAVAEWREPAAQGNTDALFNLAQAYRLGRGVPSDIARARELYLQAAQQGHIKAADNYGLLLFQQGEQAKAMPLIEAASNRGDARAQYVMGLAHFNADYAPKDWVRAYALLTLAQAGGLPQASKALGQMDKYIPLDQRQAAQSLAVSLKKEADQRLNARLAASDLGAGEVPAVPIASGVASPAKPAASSQVAATMPVPSTTPARSNMAPPLDTQSRGAPRGLPPAPQPVEQYRLANSKPLEQPKPRAPHRSTSPGPATPVSTSVQTTTAQPKAASQTSVAGNWGLQLGAFSVSANADKLWEKLAGIPALAGTRKSLLPSGRVTRLLAVGFESQSAASKACAALKRQGHDCLVKKP